MALTRPLAGVATVTLLALALLALLPDCASACTCAWSSAAPQERAQRALKESTAVFAGEVVKISKGEPLTVSFQVSEVWKGPEQENLEVSTSSQESACGYPFSEGRKYLVYAEGNRMLVHICGETTALSKASAHLEVLGTGETLGSDGALVDTSGGFLGLWISGRLGLAMAAVSSVVLLRLNRPS
jgi:hypothetical protein